MEGKLVKEKNNLNDGAKTWYIADGWITLKQEAKNVDFEGHEALMILNCRDKDAEIFLDIFFEDAKPIEGIKLKVSAKRVKCFRMDKSEEIGGNIIPRLTQYALRVRSNIEVIVQFGRMDITQPNLAYMGIMAYPEN